MSLSLPDVIAIVEASLPGWDWLVRSDPERGAFANITSPDFAFAYNPRRILSGSSFPCYAKTPAEALFLALQAAVPGTVSKPFDA